MIKFVLDASAWIEYLGGSDVGRKVANIVDDEASRVFTSSVTIAEVMSKFLRVGKDASVVLECIQSVSTIVDVTPEISVDAGNIHFEAKKKNKDFGMLDAFVIATARSMQAKILTSDYDFKGFKNVIIL